MSAIIPKGKILVIDDTPNNLILLQELLSDEGYEILLSNGASHAFTTLKKELPDLILLDIMMPEMNGYEVCKLLKEDVRTATIPVIFLSALNDLFDKVKAFQCGAVDYITKPFQIEEILVRIETHLTILRQQKDLELRNYKLTEEIRKRKEIEFQLKKQNEQIKAELNHASQYVLSLLPSPPKFPLKVEQLFFPSLQLGGDIFGYFWLNEDEFVIYLLDVAGHGVRSALLSVSLFNLLQNKSLFNVNFSSPKSVLTELNNMYSMSDDGEDYFTLWYGVYHQRTRQLTYACAGHPPALLFSKSFPDNQFSTLSDDNIAIGLVSQCDFQERSCFIPPDSSLYLYSDGIYEVETDAEKYWGIFNFFEYLKEYHDTIPFADLLKHLQDKYLQTSFPDDVSLLKVEFP